MKRKALVFLAALVFTGVVFGQERDEVMEIALTQGYNNGYEQAYSEFFGAGYEPMLGAALAEAGYNLQLQETIAEYNEQLEGLSAPSSYDEFLQQAYDYGFEAGRSAGLEYAAIQPPLPEDAVAEQSPEGAGSEQAYDPAMGIQDGPAIEASLGGQVYSPGIIISSSGSVSFEPLQIRIPKDGDTEYYAGSGVQWGDEMELGLSFSIFDIEERYGGQISLSKEYGDAAAASGVPSLLRENTSVWIKPFKWIRLEVGSFQRGIFDSSTGGGEFFTYMGPVEENSNNVFQNFRGVQGSGVLINLYPIPNLALGALVNPLWSARYDNWGRLYDAKDVYKNGQYAAAYTIPNIGTARVQYIGGGDVVHPALNNPDYLLY
ncbi:MAG: hypothetical protein LBC62_07740, partial [Treponema sp.]|nr:hypothetical protein [Treponema sp.]